MSAETPAKGAPSGVPRYTRVAQALLDAPDPVLAIAYELAEQGSRIDGLARSLSHLEAAVDRMRRAAS